MRNRFDSEITHLHTAIIEMGALCESAIANATKALLEGAKENAENAEMAQEDIRERQHQIESMCYKLLLRQQPVARDLRQVSSSLKIITDMERIGDQASDIAEIALLGNVDSRLESIITKKMAIETIGMVTDCIDAYVQADVKRAEEVVKHDDVVDELFDRQKQYLAECLATSPHEAEGIIDLLMVSKHLERIADHAVNIAKWVYFAASGNYYDFQGEAGA